MSNKATVQRSLEINFGINKVKHTDQGFKINTDSVNGSQIQCLSRISPLILDVEIKRSGTGVVIIVELKPEERES